VALVNLVWAMLSFKGIEIPSVLGNLDASTVRLNKSRFGMQDLNPMFEEWDAPSSSVVTSKRKKATPDTGVRENTNSLNQRLGTTTRSAISNIQPVSVEKAPRIAQGSSRSKPSSPRWTHGSGPARVDHQGAGGGAGQALRCGNVSVGEVAVGVLARRAFDQARSNNPTDFPQPPRDRGRLFVRTSTGEGPLPRLQFRDLSGRLRPAAPAGKKQRLAVRASWLRFFPHAAFYLKHAGAGPLDLLTVLLRLRHRYPDKAWYLLTHDDTFVFPYHLLCELRGNSPKDLWYAGAQHCLKGLGLDPDLFKCGAEFSPLGSWINGGAGVVLSKAMVDRMAVDECISRYNHRWRAAPLSGADVVMACCAADAVAHVGREKGQPVHLPGFTAGPLGFADCQCDNSCSLRRSLELYEPWRRVTYHGLMPQTMERLGKQLKEDFPHVQQFTGHGVVYLYPAEMRLADKQKQEAAAGTGQKFLAEWFLEQQALKVLLRNPGGITAGGEAVEAASKHSSL